MPGYYIGVGSATAGPFTLIQLKTQKMSGATPVWHDGLPRWVYARELAELQSILQPDEPPAQSPRPARGRRFARLATPLITIVFAIAIILAKQRWPAQQKASPSQQQKQTDGHPAAFVERHIQLPLLTVRGSAGAVIVADFRVSRSADTSAPLLVSVEEDTPSGAGPAIRASVWVAAAVAGLQQCDDLGGVRISVRLPGQIDGPSAGLAACLALLSELNGQNWPGDVAVTGAVLPDGTVGPVGGVRHKLVAAAAAGKRRMLIPALAPIERDDANGNDVDLKALAKSLNLELVLVQDVSQAYRAVQGRTANVEQAPPPDLLTLPVKLEASLDQSYHFYLNTADRELAALAPERRAAAERDQFLGPMLIARRAAAVRAFAAGRKYPAVMNARGVMWAALAAKLEDVPVDGQTAEAILERSGRDLPVQLGKRLTDVRQFFTDVKASVQNSTEAQFSGWICEPFSLTANLGELRERTINELQNEKEPAQRARIAAALASYERRIAFVIKESADVIPMDLGEMAEYLDKVQPPDARRARSVERLLYGACMAVGSAMEADLGASADRLGVSPGDLLNIMSAADGTARTRHALIGFASLLHDSLHDGSSSTAGTDPIQYAAAAHIYAECLAQLTASASRWQAFGYSPAPDAKSGYLRADAIRQSVDATRTSALTSIAECRRRGIQCVWPVMLIQVGDQMRADGEDLVEGLTAYVCASVQAKVLIMLNR